MNLIDFHLNPQSSLDAPRWQWTSDKTILVEPDFSTSMAKALSQRGHDIRFASNSDEFGRGQIILRNPESGILMGATEARTDSSIAVW